MRNVQISEKREDNNIIIGPFCCMQNNFLSFVSYVFACIEPFQANIVIKTRENQTFSGIPKGYKMGTLAGNGLNVENEKRKGRGSLTSAFSPSQNNCRSTLLSSFNGY